MTRPEPSLLALSADDPAACQLVAAAVAALVTVDRARLTISLSGEELPQDLVAALVAGLRRLRDRGGAIAVEPASSAIRDALSLYGLDRVFAFPIEETNPPRRSGPRPRIGRAAAAAMALIVGFFVAAPVRAQMTAGLTDPAQILQRVIDRNPSLDTYQGRLHVEVRLTSFPFIRQHLDATTYYKRPSNYEVVFDRVPSYARGFEKLYTDVGDPSSWAQRFFVTYQGETTYGDHRDVVLRLVQRVRGMIDHETVLVDPKRWTIDQIRYDYYNGGSITMSQVIPPIGGYLLLASQRADITIPHVRAVAYGTYDQYQTNVAVERRRVHREETNCSHRNVRMPASRRRGPAFSARDARDLRAQRHARHHDPRSRRTRRRERGDALPALRVEGGA